MGTTPVIISTLSLCVSIFTLWRTRTSLSVYQAKDGTIQVTNNSGHAVTLVELGMVERDGRCSPFSHSQEGPALPYRLDARDTVAFKPSIGMTVELTMEHMHRRRSGCYTRMASGQLLGSQGRLCSDVNAVRRVYWRMKSLCERD
ncbi:hypothetical protein D3C80_1319890 [compost metagenome]